MDSVPDYAPMSHPEEDLDEDQQRESNYAQRVREHMRVPKMIVEAYCETWHEFYRWEEPYCENTLTSLQAPLQTESAILASYDRLLEDTSSASNGLEESMQLDSPVASPSPSITISSTDLDGHESEYDHEEVVSISFLSIASFAYPKYESCTPAVRSIFYRRGQQELGFIPYADEPGFQVTIYAGLYNTFAWQTSWYDVDFKLIALSATWVLHGAGISSLSIDEQQIPFFPAITGRAGLLSTMHNRDLIKWGTSVSSDELSLSLEEPSLPSNERGVSYLELRVLEATSQGSAQQPSLWKSVSRNDSLFCRSIACVQALCTMHKHPKHPLKHTKHRKSNRKYAVDTSWAGQEDEHGPCDANCHRSQQDVVTDDDPLIVSGDVCDALKIFPDASMCKLASLCRVDCRDVYHHRLLLLPRKHSTIPRDEDDNCLAAPVGFEQEQDPYLCDHNGPCTPELCACARDDRRCCRRCSCFGRCARRKDPATPPKGARDPRKGCACKDGICKRGSCPCQCSKDRWECSPELCSSVSGRKHSCAYMDMQREEQPDIVIKQGSYGLGAFANSDIPRWTYLGEYVAEMFPMPPDASDSEDERFDEAERRVNNHRKLNYMFTVARSNTKPGDCITLLDAATAGNPTRYFNDSTEAELNVHADTVTVDGDRRIKLWAKKNIKKGQELLLGYGPGYWLHDEQPNSDDKRVDTESVTLADEQDKDEVGRGQSRTACDDDEKDNA